ncbi:MAG: ASPIC/UnbV domain-containing protein [Planctomycetota bacterium]
MDPTKAEDFQENDAWEQESLFVNIIERAHNDDGEGPPFRSIPFSGGERNRLFMNQGDNFKDFTLVSGADYREDGRGFALVDYDQDGFLDMAIVSPNKPKFRVVRNKMGDVFEDAKKNHFLKVNLIGGNTTSEPSDQWSPRDAYGATLLVEIAGIKRIFSFDCSEGLSSQNSRLVHVGLGRSKQADKITVNWPSGKKTVVKNLPYGETVTIYENPDRE